MSSHEDPNDTFLSRVFGLHSIYNQLQDNYQYYDPDADTIAESESTTSSPLLRPSQPTAPQPRPENLLDSENDSDLLSEEEHEAYARIRRPQSVPQEVPEPPTTPKKLTFNVPSVFKKLPKLPLPLYEVPQQQFRKPPPEQPTPQTVFQRTHRNRVVIPPRERALYLWANIVNMDEFLIDLYYYYRGKGLLNIVLGRVVSMVILVFTLSFTVFLKWGINYSYFVDRPENKVVTLLDLVIPHFLYHRVPFSIKFLLFGFSCYIILRIVQLYFDYNYKLKEIQNFYRHLINIANDDELMTILWSVIVERLMLLKDYNTLTATNTNVPPHYLNDLNGKIRLNAHDIANRIMRKENYMIALINKEVLDLLIPMFSQVLSSLVLGQMNVFTTKSVLTKTLEWNLKLCINNFVFNNHGQINNNILQEASRNQLAAELSSRFKMAAIINLILCPFIVVYFVLLYFFRYFNEYKSNPLSILGLRQYTPWAEWKLREFNELPHFFIKRLHLSIGPANTYINQFPGGFLVINMMSLVNFVAGAFTAVLVIFGIWFEDEEHSFWSFEITPGRSSLFYISLFGTVWAITSNSINSLPNLTENHTQLLTFFYDPEASLRYVSQFTHYLPSLWNGRLHLVAVKNEFCELYSLKIIIIINEIISLILTPFILWFKVSSSAGAIIDFFRECSVHVDGLGYVCYFAMFNFEEKDKNMMYDLNKRKKRAHGKKKILGLVELDNLASSLDLDSSASVNDYYQDDKMIKSYMYFLESYQPKSDKKKPPAQPAPRVVLGSRLPDSISLNESAYNVTYKFDESVDERRGRKGVLGMLNQFSKQDIHR